MRLQDAGPYGVIVVVIMPVHDGESTKFIAVASSLFLRLLRSFSCETDRNCQLFQHFDALYLCRIIPPSESKAFTMVFPSTQSPLE